VGWMEKPLLELHRYNRDMSDIELGRKEERTIIVVVCVLCRLSSSSSCFGVGVGVEKVP
jgi:hypothetical protein